MKNGIFCHFVADIGFCFSQQACLLDLIIFHNADDIYAGITFNSRDQLIFLFHRKVVAFKRNSNLCVFKKITRFFKLCNDSLCQIVKFHLWIQHKVDSIRFTFYNDCLCQIPASFLLISNSARCISNIDCLTIY